MKFLGLHIYSKFQNANSAKHVTSKLRQLLTKVDKLPIRGQFEVHIHDRYITSCVRFDLTVCDLAQSNLDYLDTLVRTFIRKWCGMPQSTHIGHMFHSSGVGMDLPSHLYISGHSSTLSQPSQSDTVLKEAVKTALDDMSDAKENSCSSQVSLLVQDSQSKAELSTNIRLNKNRRIEEHANSSVKQGCWSEALALMEKDISWKACLLGLSETTYSFAVRSLVDSLPTNSNLVLWKKLVSPQCGSCG